MQTIHFDTATAIIGLSRRSLWRRISAEPGSSETIGKAKGHTHTRINIDSALAWSGLTLNEEERALIPAADAGDAVSQSELGLVLIEKKLPERAVYWLKQAAAQGQADAMQWLGKLYAQGEGVEKDEAQAIEWIKQAAEHGHQIAQRQIEELEP